jgi:hypothetical protein
MRGRLEEDYRQDRLARDDVDDVTAAIRRQMLEPQ